MHDSLDISNPVVISVGGALIVSHGKVNVNFLSEFSALIRKHVSLGRRFMLIAGGGGVCREYRDAGRAVVESMTNDDLDWLGIHATRLNGHLLRTIFKDIAHHRMIENYDHKLENWIEPVVIGAGWKPGWSSDYCATYLAKDHDAKVLINLSNIDFVYDSDPKLNPNAKPLEDISWSQIQDMLGSKWVPGLNAPFDPIASKLAQERSLTVVVANGRNLNNLENILDGRSFTGTVIQ
ncbi:UMP kinase [Candidatus Woesebacteria bacterium]|nr:UMP kinase [Candidatus Woesebacteria bacterium]